MPPDYEFFTDPQRISRLPKRPWQVHAFEASGTTVYQVLSADGDVITTCNDAEFEGPGAARAIAESIVKWSNAEAEAPPTSKPPPATGRGHLRLV